MENYEVKDPQSGRVLNSAPGVEFKEVTATSYTVLKNDHNDVIEFNNASDITVTLPDNVPAGFQFWARKTGVGNIILSAATTLKSFPQTPSGGQTQISKLQGTVKIFKKDANTWAVMGDVATHFSEETGTTYTLLDADNGNIKDFANALAITVTLPNGIKPGFRCKVRKTGAGNVVLSAAGSLQSIGANITTQYGYAELFKKDATTWVAIGNLS